MAPKKRRLVDYFDKKPANTPVPSTKNSSPGTPLRPIDSSKLNTGSSDVHASMRDSPHHLVQSSVKPDESSLRLCASSYAEKNRIVSGSQKRKLPADAEVKSQQQCGNGRSSAKKPKLSGKKGLITSNRSKFQELLGESTAQESDFK